MRWTGGRTRPTATSHPHHRRGAGRGAALKPPSMARLPLLLGLAAALSTPVAAQGVGAAIDPDAPLDPMPAIAVAWPTLPPASGAGRREAVATTRYQVDVAGLEATDTPGLLARFRQDSALRAGKGRADGTGQIDRRVRADEELLTTLLRSRGYYDASVRSELVPGAQSEALTVRLVVAPGALYRLDEVALPGLAGAAPVAVEARAAFGVAAGDPAAAQPVQEGRAALASALADNGYPFATVAEPRATIDHATGAASLTVAVDPGERARVGAIRVNGDAPFGAEHTADIAEFEPGDLYSAAEVEDLRRALVATGIVGSVRVAPVAAAPGVVDIGVDMTTAKLRTVAGSLGYGTGEGARAEVSWQHRNLIRPEGAVTLRGVAGTQEQSVSADLRMNNFGARDRILTAQIAASVVDRPAYQANFVSLTAGLERKSTFLLQKVWTWSVGTELLASDERAALADTGLTRRRTYLIAALPLALGYDGSDSLLDPTTGVRVGLRLSPELSLRDGTQGYLRAQLDASGYLPVSDAIVLAARGRLGTIVGLARDQLAPSRRFYAGGGASVRGYGFQDIGPRDINNDPIGGRSLSELSAEARVRFGAFGVVPFVDAGNISAGGLPTLDQLRIGAGLGLRYYSAFGPIRVDVGTPLNPQPGDPAVAVYVSLGQAY